MKILTKVSIAEKSPAWTVKAASRSTGETRRPKKCRLRCPIRGPFIGLASLLGLILFLAPVVFAETTHFLHSNGDTCSPGPSASATVFSLDSLSPTAAQAKCRDSAGVNRTTFQQIGTWTAAPSSQAQLIAALSDLHVWIGLKNSDDVGTNFDLRVELNKNGVLIASGVTQNIQGVVRNANQAKEVTVTFGGISDAHINSGDVLSVNVLTKVTAQGGHSNATGLRLYYDATTCTSRFGITTNTAQPTAQITTPASGALLNSNPILVTGTVNDPTATVTVNGVSATVSGGNFTASGITLQEGSNTITAVATNSVGTGNSSVTATLDTIRPSITASATPAPNAAGWNNSNVTVTFNCSDGGSGVIICPNPITVTSEGGSQLVSGAATDRAGNSATASVTLNIDKTSPTLVLSFPTIGLVTPNTTIALAGTASDANVINQVSVNGATVNLTNGAFSRNLTLASGSNLLTVTATDIAGNMTTVNRTVTLVAQAPETTPPPDLSGVAPPFSRTKATSLASATAFLYSGQAPIQTGVSPETIVAERAAVMRGSILDYNGHPLSGVTVRILNHPEYGQTLSRANGMFDMAVNGGGLLTVVYKKEGFPSAQRQIDVPWQDYALLPEVVLIPYDSRSNHIDLTTFCDANMLCTSPPMQVAQGNPVTDGDGVRQATLLFPRGTTVAMTLANGSAVSISDFHVRATEYTVGPNGPKAMPAALPPTSGYTYEAEFSVDEAEAAGATRVSFSQPIISYTENFLGFPVGMNVPSGDYDREKGVWIPAPNGRVVKILSITNGLANLDLDGSGQAANAAALAALGISSEELQNVALLYQSGQSLWRVPVDHFLAME